MFMKKRNNSQSLGLIAISVLSLGVLSGCNFTKILEQENTFIDVPTGDIVEEVDTIEVSELRKNIKKYNLAEQKKSFVQVFSENNHKMFIYATPIEINQAITSINLTRTVLETGDVNNVGITTLYKSFEGSGNNVYYYDSVNNELTTDSELSSDDFYFVVYTIDISNFSNNLQIDLKINNNESLPWTIYSSGAGSLKEVEFKNASGMKIGSNFTTNHVCKPDSGAYIVDWMNGDNVWDFNNSVSSDMTLISRAIQVKRPMVYNCIFDGTAAYCRENHGDTGRNVYNPEKSGLALNAANRGGILLNKDYPLSGAFEITVEFGMSAWDQGYIGYFPYLTEHKAGIILKQANNVNEFINQTDATKMIGLLYNNKDNKICEYVNGAFSENHDLTDSASIFDLHSSFVADVSNPNAKLPMLKVKITRDSSNNLKAIWYKKLANDLDYSLLTNFVFETNFSGDLLIGLTQYNVSSVADKDRIYFINPAIAGIEHTTKVKKYCFADPGVYQEHGEIYLSPTSTHTLNNYRVSNPIYKTTNFVDGNYVGSFGGDGYTEVAHSANGKWGANFFGCSVWGPQIIKKEGIYYSFYTMGGGARGSALGYATASSIDGIWTDQGPMLYNSHNKGDTIGLVPNGTVTSCKSQDYNGDLIDSYVVEENGQWYMFYGSFAGIYRRTLTFNGTTVTVGDTATLVVGNTTYNLNQIEGTAVRKINGYWYLFGSSGRMGSDDENPSSITNPYHIVAYKGGTSITDSFSSESTTVVSSRTTGSDRIYAVGGCDFAEINGELYMVYHGRSLNAFNSGIKYRTLLVDKIICDSNGPHVEGCVPQGATGF